MEQSTGDQKQGKPASAGTAIKRKQHNSNGGNNNNNRNRQQSRGPSDSKKPKNGGRGGGGGGGVSGVCFKWAESASCDRGDSCHFLHDSVVRKPPSASSKLPKDTTVPMDVENNIGGNRNRQRNRNQREGRRGGRGGRSDEAKDVRPITEPTIKLTSNTASDFNMKPDGDKATIHITNQKFADLAISEESRRAMKEVFQYEYMTQVQHATLPLILTGNDCLAKAKTGTGKTLGFLIPTIERIAKGNSNQSNTSMDIGSLVISPTRELAFQISKEAEKLVTFHKGIRVVTVVGGTPINKDLKALKQSVQILVATPGRLLDHMQNAGLPERMANLDTLIMDEADQLLDMGFRPDIERILGYLSKSIGVRQTLLFSATVPDSVSEIARIALRPSYEFVNTVSPEEEQTHLHVRQEYVVATQADQVHALASLLLNETSHEPYKVICFFTTARLTGFMAELFNGVKNQTGFDILEIHSRKSQSARQKASDKFRKSTSAVLFSSDVSARGMDYPDVTAVIQVGLTERSQYIHRLGRTARAGKGGHGVLLCAPYEQRHMILKELKDLPLQESTCPPLSNQQRSIIDGALKKVSQDKDLHESAEQAYRAWLGYYNGNLKKCGWNKSDLVSEANQWAKDVGLQKQPTILKKTVGKMGLKGVAGLAVE